MGVFFIALLNQISVLYYEHSNQERFDRYFLFGRVVPAICQYNMIMTFVQYLDMILLFMNLFDMLNGLTI